MTEISSIIHDNWPRTELLLSGSISPKSQLMFSFLLITSCEATFAPVGSYYTATAPSMNFVTEELLVLQLSNHKKQKKILKHLSYKFDKNH